MLRSDLLSLRSQFSRCPEGFRKQIGLRYVKEGLQLVGKNDEHAARMLAQAKFHLPYAEAV